MRICAPGGAPHRQDEGKAELRLVATVEVVEAGRFYLLDRLPSPAPVCSREDSADEPGARPEIGVGAQQRQLGIPGGFAERASANAWIMASREGNGRAPAAWRATQGECSATPPNAATKAFALRAFTSASESFIAIGLSVLPEPDAERAPLGFGHAGLIAERHGMRLHGLPVDQHGKAPDVIKVFQAPRPWEAR